MQKRRLWMALPPHHHVNQIPPITCTYTRFGRQTGDGGDFCEAADGCQGHNSLARVFNVMFILHFPSFKNSSSNFFICLLNPWILLSILPSPDLQRFLWGQWQLQPCKAQPQKNLRAAAFLILHCFGSHSNNLNTESASSALLTNA